MNGVWEESLFFGAVVSLLAYEVGLMLKHRFRLAILNPLLIAVICVIGVNAVMKVDYQTYNAGGQYLSYLLTPATVCLAVPLYEQLALLKKHLTAVICGIVAGVLASMVGVLICALVFGLEHELYVTLAAQVHHHCHWYGRIGRTGRHRHHHGGHHHRHRYSGQRNC